jgi:hypothetical protein
MPSAGSVTDLVIFAGFAVFSTILIWVFLKFTPMGKRMTQNNTSQIDYTRPAPSQPKAKYSDPISARALRIWYFGFGLAIMLFFVYYFITKGGFYTGN